MSDTKQQVWVAYASVEQQILKALPFFEGMTLAQAIEQSQIQAQYELPEPLKVGIFGTRILSLDHVLNVGDRVEIYRPLTINPKEIRRKRAAKNPVGNYCRGNRFKQLS